MSNCKCPKCRSILYVKDGASNTLGNFHTRIDITNPLMLTVSSPQAAIYIDENYYKNNPVALWGIIFDISESSFYWPLDKCCPKTYNSHPNSVFRANYNGIEDPKRGIDLIHVGSGVWYPYENGARPVLFRTAVCYSHQPASYDRNIVFFSTHINKDISINSSGSAMSMSDDLTVPANKLKISTLGVIIRPLLDFPFNTLHWKLLDERTINYCYFPNIGSFEFETGFPGFIWYMNSEWNNTLASKWTNFSVKISHSLWKTYPPPIYLAPFLVSPLYDCPS